MVNRLASTVGVLLSIGMSAAFAVPAEAAGSPTLSPPPPASESASDVTAWRTSYVDETGVLPIGASENGMEYGVNGSFSVTPAGTVKGWMRWEEFTPTTLSDGVTRSFRQLVEVDCQGGRGRLLALDLYPYNNLQGQSRHVDAQDPQWTYARPGSVLEQNIGLMCSAASAVVTAAVQANARQGQAASALNSSLSSSVAK